MLSRGDHGEEPRPASLVHVLLERVRTMPQAIAYTFLADGGTDARSISWSDLDRRARSIAALLTRHHACGQPVLLTLPSGLAFIESLFACWYAGAIAVPLSLPRHRRVRDRLGAVMEDSGARIALGTPVAQDLLQPARDDAGPAAGLCWIDPATATITAESAAILPGELHGDVALLQYTSGSTGSPRGVVVTHRNLLHNSALIAEVCGHRAGEAIGGWLPLFHDMGLIGLIVQAAAAGLRCVFMSPERFLMRPWLWLRMISHYGLCSSPAPNFAYDLCAEKIGPEHLSGLDLSCWRNALNGSEAVRSETIERFSRVFAACGFRRKAFLPCYGLAEATLLVTGASPERHLIRRFADAPDDDYRTGRAYVGCGRPYGDTRLAIVDPAARVPTPAGGIGEIWVTGSSVAAGYWRQPGISQSTFRARMAVEHADETADPPEDRTEWLRTGDLGFIADGELFITARLRDMIIVAGRNHFPGDIEHTVECADAAMALAGAAAFAIERQGAERLIVAAEVRRVFDRPGAAEETIDAESLCGRIRAAVAAEHEVTPHEVVLLRTGALPRTSSGKIRRFAARAAYLSHTLERWEGPARVCAT